HIRGDSLGGVIDLLVLDDYLLVSDYPEGGHAIQVFRLDDGRSVSAFGGAGEGPGEFRSSPDLIPVPGAEDAFWAFDANQARITLFRLDDVLAGRTRGTRQINLEVPRILYELALLDADEAVGLGLFG